MTRFVHSQEAVDQAEAISAALFSGDVTALTAEEIEQGFKQFPSTTAPVTPENIVTWLVDTTKIESSRRQAREDIQMVPSLSMGPSKLHSSLKLIRVPCLTAAL